MPHHASSRKETDHGGRSHHHRYVLKNPSVVGAPVNPALTIGPQYPSCAPVGYVEFPRNRDLTPFALHNTGVYGQGYVATLGIGGNYIGPSSYQDATPWNPYIAAAPTDNGFVNWELRGGMGVGTCAHPHPPISHDGIGVGAGGTSFFSFAFNPSLLPDEFFLRTQEYGFVKFGEVTCTVTPKSPRMWPAGASGGLDGTLGTTAVTEPMAAQVPGTWGTIDTVDGPELVTSNPALSTFKPAGYKWTPPTGFPASVHCHAFHWNQLGATDADRVVRIPELLERADFVRIALHEPISCTRRIHGQATWWPVSVLPNATPLQQASAYFQGEGDQALGALHIPVGGFSNPLYGSVVAPTHQFPLFFTNMFVLAIDTNDSMLRSRAPSLAACAWTNARLYQDFTCGTTSAAGGDVLYANDKLLGPQVMNPPLEFDVTYVVDVHFYGKPVERGFLGSNVIAPPPPLPPPENPDEDDVQSME